jgi:arylsulfatase A-like enzyme
VDEYDAAIHRGDRGMGALLAVLEKRGVLGNTIVVLTSDHGEEFLEHGRCYHIRSLYREIVHVPLVVSVPGVQPRRVAGVVPASASITPTVLDLVGRRPASIGDGSLQRAIAGGAPGFGYVVSETSSRYVSGRGYGHVRALTGNDEKLVHWVAQGRYEYFDLRSDPREMRPIGSPRIQVLARVLERWVEAHPPRVDELPDVPLPEALRKELRKLGYID